MGMLDKLKQYNPFSAEDNMPKGKDPGPGKYMDHLGSNYQGARKADPNNPDEFRVLDMRPDFDATSKNFQNKPKGKSY